MKKITALLLALMMLAGVLAGCGKPKDTGKAGKLKVVTTIFPEYDWVRAILGDKADNAEITMLLDNGVDLHSYQPTADDIVKISDCDLFVYVGGESDGWVENALKNAANRKMKVINLLEVLGDSVKTEETVEGMQEDGHDHGHSHDEQLTEDDIRDRTLSDFAGAWKSLHPYLLNGDLDKFCQHRAEEDEDSSTTKDTYLEKYKASWQCDAEKISIEGNNITFTYADGKTVSAEYTYAGYQPKRNDEGKIRSVRYQFETTSADAPKYVQFNDHGHEPGEAEHFHIYFGNDGFDALMSAKTNPFFVKDALSVEDILDELMGHDHGEEKDEHVWLSLKNAKTLVGAIADALQELDPDNKDTYAANAAAYIEKLSALETFLADLGHPEHLGSRPAPQKLQKVLNDFRDRPEGIIVARTLLRAMSRARYSEKPLGHYGLASRDYCHFTSPIRRYPDLLAHRMLKLLASGKLDEASSARWSERVAERAAESSDCEERAAMCERDGDRLMCAAYLSQHIGETYTGVITHLSRRGAIVLLKNTAEGRIPPQLMDDFYSLDDERLMMVGRHTRRVLRLGDTISVEVYSAEITSGEVEFAMTAR
mgnify:CR=1 FL=1